MTHEAKLNNAAGKFAEALWKEMQYELAYDNLVEGFIAGAKWAMEQGTVVDGEIGYWNQTGLSILLDKSLEKLGFDMDEKVVVQIRKI